MTQLTRRSFIRIASASTLALLFGCGTSAPATNSDSSTVHIDLPYEAGTGFEWSFTCSNEDTIVLSRTEVVDLSGDEPVSGGPLEARYTLEPQTAGTATIRFALARPWDDSSTAGTASWELEVADTLAVSVTSYTGDARYEDCLTLD